MMLAAAGFSQMPMLFASAMTRKAFEADPDWRRRRRRRSISHPKSRYWIPFRRAGRRGRLRHLSVPTPGLTQMLLQPRHQLDQIARPKPVVQLVPQNILPGVAAGAGRAGEGEEIGAAGDTGGGPRLDGRGPDLLPAEPAEDFPESRDRFFVDRLERLGRHVPAGHARSEEHTS